MTHTDGKTIFLTISVSAKINFILRSDFPKFLKQEGFRVVILSPFWNEDFFIKEFGKDYILELLEGRRRYSLANILNNFRNQALLVHNPRLEKVQNINKHLHRRFSTPRVKFSTRLNDFILSVIPKRLRFSPEFWNKMERLLARSSLHNALFKKYRPAAVVVDSLESNVLVYCQKYKIPSVYVDMNIDALWARYPAPLRTTTRIAALSEDMKRDAMEVHGIQEERLLVVGSIRMDYLLRPYAYRPRDEFLKSIGADSKKRLLLFATIHPLVYPQHPDVIRLILDAIKSGKIKEPTQLMVSYLATDTTPYSKLFAGEENLILKPAKEKPHKDYIANLLRYTDVSIAIGSTMSLEAAAAGTPAIWIGFDGFAKYQNPEDSIKYSFEMDYLKRCLEGGGVRLAENPDNLIAAINEYLRDRDKDAEKRRALLEKTFYKPDGNASLRLARAVAELVRAPSQ